MKPENKFARLTIDLPEEDHKRLKALAAMHGKSMRTLVLEAVETYISTIKNDGATKSLTQDFNPLSKDK